ncbi:MAG TPA: hypothetical protein VGE45_17325 [Chloroflexia bacterium]|jgi:hypothetical protein
MKMDDPLPNLTIHEHLPKGVVTEVHTRAKKALRALPALLDASTLDKKLDLAASGMMPFTAPVPLSPKEMSTAQELYRRVVAQGGFHSHWVQEGLLGFMAATADLDSIPFWQEMIGLVRPRDQFAAKRKVFALAALAYIAIRHELPAAYDALHQVARHPDPNIRSLAVYYLAHAYMQVDHPPTFEAGTELVDIAVKDPDFAPRFQVRAMFRAAGLPTIMDVPEGVFAFKVKFMWDKRIYRVIEMRSNHTLADLHHAIQHAIKWDDDHLYSFHMGGELDDPRYQIPCADAHEKMYGQLLPFFDYVEMPDGLDEGEEEDEEEEVEEGAGKLVAEDAVLGELGLVLKHKFIYQFDYGDNHQFEVEVVDIKPKAERGRYPRVVKAQGEAPPQYEMWDEEDDDEPPDE